MTPTRCATRSCAPCATSSPTTWAGTSLACAASASDVQLNGRSYHEPTGFALNRRPRMPEAVIVDAVRTPIGRAMKGSLKTVRADELAAVPLEALQERNPAVDFGQTDDIY